MGLIEAGLNLFGLAKKESSKKNILQPFLPNGRQILNEGKNPTPIQEKRSATDLRVQKVLRENGIKFDPTINHWGRPNK